MERHFDIINYYSQRWAGFVKNTVLAGKIGNRNGFAIVFEVDSLRVVLAVTKGRRGGVYGAMVVIDPKQKVLIDQLLCANSEIGPGNSLMNGLVYGELKNRASNFDAVCPAFLTQQMQTFLENRTLVETTANLIGFGNESVLTVSGGLPSLGKQ